MVSDAESLLLFASCYGQVRVITPVLPAGLGRLRNHPFLSKILGSCPFLLSLLPDIKAMTANSPFLLRFLTSGGKTRQWHSLLSYVLGMQPPPSSGCRGPHSTITVPHAQSRLIQQLETLRARRFQEVPNLYVDMLSQIYFSSLNFPL